ncbi:MAG: hypothetical protein H7835_20510, partial [Magnetococcus sp. XQGC-1]
MFMVKWGQSSNFFGSFVFLKIQKCCVSFFLFPLSCAVTCVFAFSHEMAGAESGGVSLGDEGASLGACGVSECEGACAPAPQPPPP